LAAGDVELVASLSTNGERKKKASTSSVSPRSGNLAGPAGSWAELTGHGQVNPSPALFLSLFLFLFFLLVCIPNLISLCFAGLKL
jgi:hypothetical protein